MSMLLLEELGKLEMLKLQQDLIERLPLDIDVALSSTRFGLKLTCKLEGSGKTADKFEIYDHDVDADKPETLVLYIISRLMKARLGELGFKHKTSGRYFLERNDRAYTAVTYGTSSNLIAPLKILARSTNETYTRPIYADVYVYSNDGINDALKFLDEYDISANKIDSESLEIISKTFS